MARDNVGFMTKKKPFTSGEASEAVTSDSQKAKDTALRAKQDIQASKEREADKGRFNKQDANAKSEAGMASANKQYAKPSNPVVDKIMAASPTTKPAPATTAPVKKPTVVSRAPVETAASRTSRQAAYDDWKKSQAVLGAPGMKKGGAVKSKIDGCAVRGKTKGKYC